MSDDFDILSALRDFQETGKIPDENRMRFEEWRAEKRAGRLAKAPSLGGIRGPINPGVGMMGRLGTSSKAPTGPQGRPSGEQLTGFKSSPSRYQSERPNQPPPYINDVDMESIWYSPMEPVWPFGPPYYNRPRDWNFPVGYNLNFIPARMEVYGMLRGMRKSWGVLSTIIETRKDQLLRLPWTIQKKDKPRSSSKGVDEVRKMLRRPDGQNTYNQWSRLLLDDLFVLDAPSVFIDRNALGKVRHFEYIDGSSIFPLIDDAGRRPRSEYKITPEGIVYEDRQPAFQQIVYGLPMINLSEDELMYSMMRPLPEMPVFGYSPVEQILVEATEAIRKTFYQLEFWRSGSMPELIVTVPDNWSPRQIATFQAHFDAMLSGQLTLKSKVRFLPGGMKPFDIKNASGESLWSNRDELLVRLACYAFSVSPTPFVRQMNRGTAQNAQQEAQEEGLYPLMSYWKDDIMDTIIQEKLGYDDIEFVFLPRPEVDLLKQAQIHQAKLHSGEMTIDEARAENGEEPYEDGIGNVPMVYFGSGAIPVEHLIHGEAALPGAGAPPGGANGAPKSNPQERSPAKAEPMQGPARARSASPQPPASPTSIHKAALGAEVEDDAEHKATPKQIKTGNYKKGHMWFHGLSISIENAKGSRRGEKDKFGRGWEVKMPTAYGYIRGTVGADGDQMDVYLGNKPDSERVFVIDQDKFDAEGIDHGFDEHKVFLGYAKLKRVLRDYQKSHFSGQGHEQIASVTEVTLRELKDWLKKGDMKRPISEQGVGIVIARRGRGGGITKADTISTSSGLSWYDQTLPKAKKKRRKGRKLKSGPRWLELKSA